MLLGPLLLTCTCAGCLGPPSRAVTRDPSLALHEAPAGPKLYRLKYIYQYLGTDDFKNCSQSGTEQGRKATVSKAKAH
jgi:hypothetical protein